MIHSIIVLLVSALIICLGSAVLPGIKVKHFGWAIVVAILIGLLNMLADKFIPQYGIIVSLLIDALAIWLVGSLLKNFTVKNFWWALGLAIFIAICQYLITFLPINF